MLARKYDTILTINSKYVVDFGICTTMNSILITTSRLNDWYVGFVEDILNNTLTSCEGLKNTANKIFVLVHNQSNKSNKD